MNDVIGRMGVIGGVLALAAACTAAGTERAAADGTTDAGCPLPAAPPPSADAAPDAAAQKGASLASVRVLADVWAEGGDVASGRIEVLKDSTGGIAMVVAFTGVLHVGGATLAPASKRGLAVIRANADGSPRPSTLIELDPQEGGVAALAASEPSPPWLVEPVGTTGDVVVAFPFERGATVAGENGDVKLASSGGFDTALVRIADATGRATWSTVIGGAGQTWPEALSAEGDRIWLAAGLRGPAHLPDGTDIPDEAGPRTNRALVVGFGISEPGVQRVMTLGSTPGNEIAIDESGVHVAGIRSAPNGGAWIAGEFTAQLGTSGNGASTVLATSNGGWDAFLLTVGADGSSKAIGVGGPGDEEVRGEPYHAPGSLRFVVEHWPQLAIDGADGKRLYTGEDTGAAEITIDEGGVHVMAAAAVQGVLTARETGSGLATGRRSARASVHGPRDPASGQATGKRMTTYGSTLYASEGDVVKWTCTRKSPGMPTGTSGLTWLMAADPDGSSLAYSADLNIAEAGTTKTKRHVVAIAIDESGVH